MICRNENLLLNQEVKNDCTPRKNNQRNGGAYSCFVDVLAIDVEPDLMAEHVQFSVGSSKRVTPWLASRHLEFNLT